MKFNKHNSYRSKSSSAPLCPKCGANANVIKTVIGFRCVYCDLRFDKKEKGGQTHLF